MICIFTAQPTLTASKQHMINNTTKFVQITWRQTRNSDPFIKHRTSDFWGPSLPEILPFLVWLAHLSSQAERLRIDSFGAMFNTRRIITQPKWAGHPRFNLCIRNTCSSAAQVWQPTDQQGTCCAERTERAERLGFLFSWQTDQTRIFFVT